MKTIVSLVINNITKIAIVSVVVSLLLTQVGTCNNSKKLYQKLGELEASTEIHNTIISNLTKENEVLLDTNKEILTSVKALKEQAVVTNKQLDENKKTIAELKNSRPNYAEECKPIVEHMQLEIDAITRNFDLAIYDIDIWIQIAHNNELGWKNETMVRVNLEKINTLIISDSQLKSDIIKELQKSLAIKKLEANIAKGGLLVVMACALIYGFTR